MGKFQQGLAEALILYVRFAAWLHTAPVPDQKKNSSKAQPKQPTRLKKLQIDRKDDLYCPDMPEIDGGEWLLQVFWDVGPAMSTPMGSAPLSHSEMRAWQETSGVELEPWQASLLRRMSAEYLAECQKAESPNCPSPLAVEMTDEDRERVSKKVGQAMRMLIDTRPKT